MSDEFELIHAIEQALVDAETDGVIPAEALIRYLRIHGCGIFYCGHDYYGPEGFCLECGAARTDGQEDG